MKHRQARTVALVLAVALLPGLASGEVVEAESVSSSGSFNPLIFVEAQFDLGLEKASSVTVSPDGAHVYVTGEEDNAVAIFGRSATGGVLTYQGSVRDGVGGVDGLEGARSVAVSPDGKHVYVAGCIDNAVAIFSRNATTGMLTQVGVVKDGVGGVDGLEGALSVIVSPNGAHVYVASIDEDALACFSRNATTGALTYLESFKDGGIATHLDGAMSVTLSPDGEHVYVAAYYDDAVTIFDRNTSTGTLTYVGHVEDGVAGVDGLYRADSVTVSPDGKHVYVAGNWDSAVAIFSRNATTGMLTYAGVVKDGVGGVVDGLGGAESVTVSPDGAHVYVAAYSDDAVTAFVRNGATGALTYVGHVEDGVGADGLEGAESVTVSPDGAHVYVAALIDDAVTAFRRDGATGALTCLQMSRTAPGLEGAAGAAVSPDGDHVYVTGNDDDAVVAFERNRGTGALAYMETSADGDYDGLVEGLDGARAVVVSPDGRSVYVAGFDDDAVAHFNRHADGGIWWDEVVQDGVGGVDGLDGPQALAISPDGINLYVAGYNDDAVAVFTRTLSYPYGELSYLGMMQDGVGGVDGLNGAYAVVVSPDGKHVYVAGYNDDAVAIFSRSAISGALTYVGVVKDIDPLINGLDGANSLAISPDGNHLYVASRHEDALQVLLRSAGTGALFEIEVHRDGVGGVDGLAGARAVALSPDGSQVYVVGQYDHALAVFARDATWGGLTFVGLHKDGVAGVNGLLGAMSIAVSPEGSNVYVGGYSDDGVAVFAKFRVYLPLVLRE
jgi:6-phosphogluconolactonase (cycloisomerase 2 family)